MTTLLAPVYRNVNSTLIMTFLIINLSRVEARFKIRIRVIIRVRPGLELLSGSGLESGLGSGLGPGIGSALGSGLGSGGSKSGLVPGLKLNIKVTILLY